MRTVSVDAGNVLISNPGPTQIHNDLGVAKGYASDMITAWKNERQFPTSENQQEPVSENAA